MFTHFPGHTYYGAELSNRGRDCLAGKVYNIYRLTLCRKTLQTPALEAKISGEAFMLFLILIYQGNFGWEELDEWAYKETEYYVFLIDFQNILKGRDEETLREKGGTFSFEHFTPRRKTEVESFSLKEKTQKQAENFYWLRG